MMIREIYWDETDLNMDKAEGKGVLPAQAHVNHCFDYLRQAIMCAGDMSIEGVNRRTKDGIWHINGWGSRHECKSYVSSSYGWVASHVVLTLPQQASREWMDAHIPW